MTFAFPGSRLRAKPNVVADFVIVGAGSAGCALAARLSEDGRYRVAIIEHGGYPRVIRVRSSAGWLSMPWSASFFAVRVNHERAAGGDAQPIDSEATNAA